MLLLTLATVSLYQLWTGWSGPFRSTFFSILFFQHRMGIQKNVGGRLRSCSSCSFCSLDHQRVWKERRQLLELSVWFDVAEALCKHNKIIFTWDKQHTETPMPWKWESFTTKTQNDEQSILFLTLATASLISPPARLFRPQLVKSTAIILQRLCCLSGWFLACDSLLQFADSKSEILRFGKSFFLTQRELGERGAAQFAGKAGIVLHKLCWLSGRFNVGPYYLPVSDGHGRGQHIWETVLGSCCLVQSPGSVRREERSEITHQNSPNVITTNRWQLPEPSIKDTQQSKRESCRADYFLYLDLRIPSDQLSRI